MMFWIFGLLYLARSCMGVLINGVDCSQNCACCKGGIARCGYNYSIPVDEYCFDGCIDGIYGWRCKNPCSGNCYTCEQINGRQCYSCKDTLYDVNSLCSKSCSVGCEGGACNVDGTCSTCTANFEGPKCETCTQGKYGLECTLNCHNQNCRCSIGTDCMSCKSGFFGRISFCQTPCSQGCQDSVCNDDGSCNCRGRFSGLTCRECQSGYFGKDCNLSCSLGCVNGLCLKDGTCTCRPNFVTVNCDTCADGRYGVNCDQVCSVGCTTSPCNKSDCLHGCITGLEGRDCTERRIYIGSSTISALAVLSGVLGISLICTATGCYLWNRRMSKSIEQSSEIRLSQRNIERTYEHLQGQTGGETNRNIDDNYAVLSI